MTYKKKSPSGMIIIGACFSVFFVFYSFCQYLTVCRNHSFLDHEVERQLRVAGVDDEDFLHNSIMARVERENIVLNPKQVMVSQSEKKVRIRVVYNDYIDFFGVQLYSFQYVIEHSKSF
jgi:hypothetical protein